MRDKQAQMALARQRLLTLAYGEMETIRMVRRIADIAAFCPHLPASCRIVLLYAIVFHRSTSVPSLTTTAGA